MKRRQPGSSTQHLASNILKRIGFFILGALVLTTFSVIQKLLLGQAALAILANPRAYVVPLLYGGITGLIIGEWTWRLRGNALKIQEKEEHLRTLVNAIPDFVIFKDGAGQWQDINDASEEIFGFSLEDAKGKTDLELSEEFPELSRLMEWCFISDEETWKSQQLHHCMVESFQTPSGIRSFDVVKVPLFWPDGNRKGLVTIGRDVTQIRRSEKMMEQAYDSTLIGWAKAVELRDEGTRAHTDRGVLLAEKLGRLVGLSEPELEQLRRGAILHDIGKISTPDSILSKPGPLSDEELAVMRQHPETAYQMLSHISFLEKALEVPYCHHERWDGSGYPRGLKGEEIPIVARIFALADVWDALTSDRPYRMAWTDDQAYAYIEDNAGSHFDPQITPVFLQLLSEEETISGLD